MSSNMRISGEKDEIKKTYLKFISYQIQFQNYLRKNIQGLQ